jgi:hypothetical protein
VVVVESTFHLWSAAVDMRTAAVDFVVPVRTVDIVAVVAAVVDNYCTFESVACSHRPDWYCRNLQRPRDSFAFDVPLHRAND